MTSQASASDLSLEVATRKDLEEIAEQLENRGSGFFYNLNILESQQSKKQLLVAKRDREILGFLSYDDNLSPCIMEVWEEHRRTGVGRFIYDGFVKHTHDERENDSVMVVECAPVSSMKFWARMGFEKLRERNGAKNKMFKLVIKPESLKSYEQIRVDIYPFGREPIFSAVEEAEVVEEGYAVNLYLRNPMVFFYQACPFSKLDLEVRISSETTGTVLFQNALLSEDSNSVGLHAVRSHLDFYVFRDFEIYRSLLFKPKDASPTGRGPRGP